MPGTAGHDDDPGMTFEDLPADWNTRPLSDPAIAVDVVDLVLMDADRVQNSVLLLMCDEDAQARVPLVIHDMDWHATADDRRLLFSVFDRGPAAGVVVAISASKPVPPEIAARWHTTAVAELARHGVTLHGFFVADRMRVRPVTAEAA